ncbi:endocuticle structural glycoprotein SgAbd-4 [Halyomorpha halys]|uniref:endocuticle structural glycoprotein SgAbd-4 n=1 Tax=Halyomorpha halys TaxID=286706 RepID=UPI0006D50056|nr:endocuticle structural glycoprotein SgAbd-4-like [Halyomorpha halys]KAE8573249.1 Cuticle Protein CPR RR-1 [Halyomorpha halys]
MIRFLVTACLFGAARSAPQVKPNDPVAIISSTDEHNPDGSYQWSYETANGIKAQETGSLKPAQDPKDGQVVVAQGSYSYTADDGTVISLTYVADDLEGFQPQGAHLPTPPPIPEAIKRALDFIATEPQQPQGQPSRTTK